MKSNYRKTLRWRARHEGDFHFEWIGTGYHRPVRTINELRQHDAVKHDPDCLDIGIRPRGRRNESNLDAWEDFNRSRQNGKSWKDYTRHRKQWMTGRDPEPARAVLIGWVVRILRDFDIEVN